MIGNLQVIRAFAASGVVYYHSGAKIFGTSTELYGVALFFVLSGYLMCKINNRNALDFLRDRAWRIIPNYWLATALLLTIFNMWTHWPWQHTVLSFLFIPHNSVAGLEPVLGVGWTLNIELYFYAIFALAVFLSRRFAPIISAAIIFLNLYGLPKIFDDKALLHYYANPYVNFFVVGIGIWYLSEWIKRKNTNLKLPKMTLPACIAAYIVAVVGYGARDAAIAALFLMAVLAANHGADLKAKSLIVLGNASFACYLLHTILIEYLRSKGVLISGTTLFGIGVVGVSWLIAVAWHLSVEKFFLDPLKKSMQLHRKAKNGA